MPFTRRNMNFLFYLKCQANISTHLADTFQYTISQTFLVYILADIFQYTFSQTLFIIPSRHNDIGTITDEQNWQ